MKKHVRLFTALVAAVMLFAGCSGGAKPNAPKKDTEPKAVTNLKARAGDGKVTLSWTNPTYEEFSSIEVWFDEDSTQAQAGNLSYHKTLGTDVTSYEITYLNNSAIPLTNGTKHLFRVEAYFGYDENNNEIVKKSEIISATPTAGPTSSIDMASRMTIGWNLGNALDASSCGDWAYNEGVKMEYSWLPHGASSKTTQKLIKTVKAAGFDTIRIPISWHNHMDKNTYVIKSYWMNRAKEIVDWAIAEDMYVIINIHHDNLTEDEIASNPGFCISTDTSIQTKSKAYIGKVWKQIAEEFKDYDYHVVFEVLNEPRCVGTDLEWGFYGSNASQAKTYCDIITAYEKAGLDKIRASGGNNADRYVMVPGYAASPSFLSSYTMPTDSVTDKLLLSTHAYTPGTFALKGNLSDYDTNKTTIESDINYVFDGLKSSYINKGIGVVMGEASASDKENTESREKWATYYFTKAKSTGIPVVLWDNEIVVSELSAQDYEYFKNGGKPGTDGKPENGENHGYFNRQTCTQYYPTVVEAMMKAVYGNGYTPGDSGNDDPETPVTEITIFDASTLTTAPSVTAGTCELVTVNDVKYIKVTPDEWNTKLTLASAVSISGKSQIIITMRTDENTSDYQANIQCIDASSGWVNVCGDDKGVTMSPLSTTAKNCSKTIETATKVTTLQIAVQDTSSWDAVSTIPVYISKIVAK